MATVKLPSISPASYTRITFVALATLVIIVITGAAVRLTGSGLGCPDWPTCANDRVVAPLEMHAWIEFGNRLFTGACSVAVAAGVLGSLLRNPRRRDLTWLSLSLVLGVIGQAVLGGVSVLMDLDPPFVMAHFLLSMIIVWAALVLHHRAGQPDGKARPVMSRGFIVLARLLAVLAFAVMFVGTMVTGSGPHGGDASAARLGFSPHDITKVHGAFVWALVAATAFTLWRLHGAKASPSIIRKAELFMVALLLQGALGYLQYSLSVPAGLVLLHIVGATFTWFAVLQLNFAMFDRWEAVEIDAFDGDVDTQSLTNALFGESAATPS